MISSITSAIEHLENESSIRVLFACESGSRAWGFASPDSDYDVRFIYVRPQNCYLSIEEGRDVVEAMLPGDLDFAGWDLRKALGLLRKSNPSLLEWIHSPIRYRCEEPFFSELKALADRWMDPERLFHHYRSMAETNWRTNLQGDLINLKKYLYVLRPVFACSWVREHQSVPPVQFSELVSASNMPSEVRHALDDLLERKQRASEMDSAPPIPALHAFLEAELVRLKTVELDRKPEQDVEELNVFFRKWIAR